MFSVIRTLRWLVNAEILRAGIALVRGGRLVRRIPVFGNVITTLARPGEIYGRRLAAATQQLINGMLSVVEGIAFGVLAFMRGLWRGLQAFFHGEFRSAWTHIKVTAALLLRIPLDAALMAFATTVSTTQTATFLEKAGRRLNTRELTMLKNIFGDSIDYSAVMIKEGFAGVASVSDRAFVTGNTIYMKNIKDDDAYLIHEMTHVWQHQTGGTRYMIDALIAQHSALGYDWTKSAPHTRWAELNPEQQAQLLEDAQRAGVFQHGHAFIVKDSSGRAVDYTCYLNAALSEIRDNWR